MMGSCCEVGRLATLPGTAGEDPGSVIDLRGAATAGLSGRGARCMGGKHVLDARNHMHPRRGTDGRTGRRRGCGRGKLGVPTGAGMSAGRRPCRDGAAGLAGAAERWAPGWGFGRREQAPAAASHWPRRPSLSIRSFLRSPTRPHLRPLRRLTTPSRPHTTAHATPSDTLAPT